MICSEMSRVACDLAHVHLVQHWRNRSVSAILRAPPPVR